MSVSTLDPAYRDLEKLIAFGVVDSLSVGQRPYTRVQFARFARQARATATGVPQNLESTLARLEQRFGSERPLRRIAFELTEARDPQRLVPPRFFGDVDAVIDPLLAYREGRRTRDGSTAAVEAIQEVRLSPSVTVLLHPRAQLAAAQGRAPEWDLDVQKAYAAVNLGNVALQLGRANMVWGQGRHAGLMISQNARAFDMIKLRNDRPFVMPWLLRALGPSDGTAFFATMAADRDRHFPDSYMLGYKLTVRPKRWLEIGTGVMLEAGGRGAPPASLLDRFLDHVFLTRLPIKDVPQFSNKLAVVDIRATIQRARGLQLYVEAASEDNLTTDWRKTLNQDAGWLIGLYAPRLDAEGRLDLSVEYHLSGIRLYRHHQFLTGLAVDQRLMGDALGPEGRAVYGELTWDAAPAHTLMVQLAYEGRRFDEYMELPNDRRMKIQDLPQELRYRAMASWHWRPGTRPFELRGLIGYERVNTFDFDPAEARDNFVVQARVEWQL